MSTGQFQEQTETRKTWERGQWTFQDDKNHEWSDITSQRPKPDITSTKWDDSATCQFWQDFGTKNKSPNRRGPRRPKRKGRDAEQPYNLQCAGNNNWGRWGKRRPGKC